LRIEDFEGTPLRIDEALKERQKGEDRIGETKTANAAWQKPSWAARILYERWAHVSRGWLGRLL
jgi:hypothetical protein